MLLASYNADKISTVRTEREKNKREEKKLVIWAVKSGVGGGGVAGTPSQYLRGLRYKIFITLKFNNYKTF